VAIANILSLRFSAASERRIGIPRRFGDRRRFFALRLAALAAFLPRIIGATGDAFPIGAAFLPMSLA
jgi:hypothetical protein